MIEPLTNAPGELENARRRIAELIGAHSEWFYSHGTGAIALSKGELDFRVSHGCLIFSCWSEQGTLHWRVRGWQWAGEKLSLEVTRRMGAERATVELVPRASVSATSEIVSAARRRNCARMALLACAEARSAKVERASLSPGARRGQPGSFARILLRLARERIAVTGTVDAARFAETDAFLSSALIWFIRKRENSSSAPRLQKLWLIVQKERVQAATERLSLLREELRRVITLYEIDDAWQELARVPLLERAELWTKHPARFRAPQAETGISEQAARIVSLAPHAIDVSRARHGETLRYHGLPFARIRRVMSSERVWFGLDGSRAMRLLEESTERDWTKLLSELQEHRRAEAADHQHALYKALPEAWLESMLRRDITRLDPGLRIAPLHAQFRASPPAGGAGSRPIDLLALRRDGRLVVIELKVSEDRQHVLQGADYWRQVEAHRRRGHIRRARLFDDAVITDESPLVYLVAPTLRFHRSLRTLAQTIDPEIEIYRFDINEDWRAGVRVMRRVALTNNWQ